MFYKIIANLLLIFLPTSFCWADSSVFVQSIDAKGMDEASAETVLELIKTNITKVDGFKLARQKTGSSLQLQPKLLKLGEAYILKIDKFKGKDLAYSSRMKSSSLEDMDVVSLRVVRSVLLEESIERAAKVTDVTQHEEAQGTRRYKATRQWKISFGPAWSSGLNVNGPGTGWSIGYIWGLDPDFDLKLDWSFYVPKDDANDDARFNNFSVGMNYFLNRDKHSPFATAGVGYASAAASENAFLISDDEASGWALTLGVGYKFFRTSTVNIGLIAKYSYLLDKTEKSDKSPSLGTMDVVIYY